MTPDPPSSLVVSAWTQRLVEQLQQISEVSEALTYRLLELEERLAGRERELAELRDQARGATQLPAAVESWLQETDERLARVEQLLRRGEGRMPAAPGVTARPLVAVPPAGRSLAEAEADPFPEEGEQAFLEEPAFLDEQTA